MSSSGAECPLRGRCAFEGLWDSAQRAVESVYDGTTLADLLAEQPASGPLSADYTI